MVTPHLPHCILLHFLVRSILGGRGLDGTQRVGTQCAKNPVISYTDINFYFKKVQFSSRSTTNVTCNSQITLKISRAWFACVFWAVISAFMNLKLDFWEVEN